MEITGIWLGFLLVSFSKVTISSGSHLTSKTHNKCGISWIPYKDTKCVKVLATDVSDKKTAEKICLSYSEEVDHDYSVLRIQDEDEQAFFSKLLFVEYRIKNNIWLEFEANIKPDLISGNVSLDVLNVPVYFSNFKIENDQSQNDGQCVQMLSPTTDNVAGLWEKVPCQKQNLVVCERPQATSIKDMFRVLMKRAVDMKHNTGNQKKGHKVCPATFTKIYDRCYFFSNYTIRQLDAALTACQNLIPRSTLLTLETKEEWNIIQEYLSAHKILAENFWWFGGTDRDHEGLWTWVKDNEHFAFSEWCPGQPDNAHKNEHCIHVCPKSWGGATHRMCFNDLKCDDSPFNNIKPRFICEPEYR